MYDRILVAVDGSDDAGAAATAAIDLARTYGATLHAIYVVETRTAYDNAIVDPDEVAANMRADGRTALDAVAADAGDVSVETHLLRGVPHEEVVDCAEARAVDLVVLGRRGRSDFRRALLGSTADGVARTWDGQLLLVGSDGDR